MALFAVLRVRLIVVIWCRYVVPEAVGGEIAVGVVAVVGRQSEGKGVGLGGEVGGVEVAAFSAVWGQDGGVAVDSCGSRSVVACAG